MKIKTTIVLLIGAIFFLNTTLRIKKTTTDGNGDWGDYLGGADRNHYSELTQINPQNVANLKVAWTYSTADSGQMQVNPLIIDGVLYGVTPTVQAFALDAATGKEIWKFGDRLNAWHSTSRGVAFWTDGTKKRILHTIGSFLYRRCPS